MLSLRIWNFNLLVSLTTLILFSSGIASAQHSVYETGIPASKVIMVETKKTLTDLQKKQVDNSKAQAAVLAKAYNKLLTEELKKSKPNKYKLDMWYKNHVTKILQLDAQTKAFLNKNLTIVDPNNPFVYRSKEGKNYLAFPGVKAGGLNLSGRIVRVDEHLSSQVRHTTFLDNIKNSANARHVQFFPREYTRFMAVSYAVTWEMCRVHWSSMNSILSFESAYRMKTPAEKKDPLCDEHFVKSLQDPVGWLGFYAFVMANHYIAPKVSAAMFNALGKKITNTKLPFIHKQVALVKFFTNIVAGGIGMTAGLTASDYVHQMKENPNLKACFKNSEQSGWFGENCKEAYKDFLMLNTAARDRMAISTMSLLSAFGLNTLAQIPLQAAIQGVRLGAGAILNLALGISFVPGAGWVVGAILYVGSTYLFLRFDHMVSPYIEKWYYGTTKPMAVRRTLTDLMDIVEKQKANKWSKPIAERAENERCFKEIISDTYDYLANNKLLKSGLMASDLKCDNPVLIDEALREFSLAMSEHRSLNILSGVSALVGIWQNKWSGFYYNYKGSMELIDLLAKYRRDYKQRLQSVDFMKRYGMDFAKRSSVDIFDGVYYPLFGFEDAPLNMADGDVLEGVNHQALVNNVHNLIRKELQDYENSVAKGQKRKTITYTHHQEPFLKSLLKINDPMLLAEQLLVGRERFKMHEFLLGKYRFAPVFPYARDFYGPEAAKEIEVPAFIEFSNLSEESKKILIEERRKLKCNVNGALEADGACALTPEEVLSLEDTYIPIPNYTMQIASDLGYENEAGERFQHVESIAQQDQFSAPHIFDPNCYTFSIFGSDNPTCFWSRGFKDSNGNPYSARFKTPLFSDYLLANMSCGISNKAYVSTSGGPKNLFGSETYFGSDGFAAQFIPPNLIKGAPACENLQYSFGPYINTTYDTKDLNRSFIRVKNKQYYGALQLVLDPSNPWIFNEDVASVEKYWNTNIYPSAKKIATTLYRQYQEVIYKNLLPLFKTNSSNIDFKHPITGSGQLKDLASFKLDRQSHTISGLGGVPVDYKALPRSVHSQFTTENLRESYIQQARFYLLMMKELAKNLSDQQAESLLVALDNYMSAMLRASVDYTLQGEAFIKEMKVKKAYHDNIMERRSKALNDQFTEVLGGLGHLEWFNPSVRDNFMTQVQSAQGLKNANYIIAVRIVELFSRAHESNATDDERAFGFEDYRLKDALLFDSSELQKNISFIKPLYYKYIENKMNLEQIFEKLIEADTNKTISLTGANDSELFKEWVLYRLKSDLLGLVGELKAQYLSEWIHGSKFYLNNLELSE